MITEEQYQKLKTMLWGVYALIFISLLLALSGCTRYDVDHAQLESMLRQQCVHNPEDFGYLRRIFRENDVNIIEPVEYCRDLFHGDLNEI